MATRYTRQKAVGRAVPTGHEGNNIPDDFDVPSCTVEDVDRALFNLFDEQIPLQYEQKGETKSIPVIFATGERFAVLRRKKPLRDRSGALILPLISIARTAIAQDVGKGYGIGQDTGDLVVKKRLAKEDARYQRVINKVALKNQDDVVHGTHLLSAKTGSLPGKIASRRAPEATKLDFRNGYSLKPDITNNIFEVITIPFPKFYTATYEVTFWAQYTQQLNDMITALMSTYTHNHGRTFRIETNKGYWFVAYVDPNLASGDNFDNFADDERLVKCTFNVQVPGYIVNPKFPGSQSGLRRFISAPQISFESVGASAVMLGQNRGGPRSGDPNDHVLQDLSTLDEEAIASHPGHKGLADVDPMTSTAMIGTEITKLAGVTFIRIERDPFTGEKVQKVIKIKTRNQRKGETVYSEGMTTTLDNLGS
jgi:hypothetical protein